MCMKSRLSKNNAISQNQHVSFNAIKKFYFEFSWEITFTTGVDSWLLSGVT